MISRSFAILLAILGLYLSALTAAAQPRGGGWGGRGGFAAGRGWGGQARFGGARGGGFGAPGYARGFPGPRAAYGGGFGAPPGYAADPRAFGGRGYDGPAYGFAPPGRPGIGGWASEQDQVRRAVRAGRQIPLGQAIEAVRRRAPGRELDAGLEAGPNGRPVYRLRWAGQDGRRQDYMVDAGTGEVLGVQGGP